MKTYSIRNINTFQSLLVEAESPELALIQVHADTLGDTKQHGYNEYLKKLCYNGRNIGLGSFCFFQGGF